ncbi:hypothetical protein WR25_13251 isoform B [Diploscapter pachys]|uniref:DET1- and DDB1-associated protein 1 domain-containing protein n=1 Tax=Diploscapter pachys TaxID=2018661 RepID=A0A2A2LWI2_9BILA|nr:hypothetical protein WR25_13251 isoform A [Diploscapter pachys]PAV90572.1 hypothetical protein WR25_13251 isoform B [Diploscapter pachys]
MTSFLRNLPCSNPNHFSNNVSEKRTQGAKTSYVVYDSAPKVINDIPMQPDERKIRNDNKPQLLRYLERNFNKTLKMDNDRKRKGGGDSSCGSSIADDQEPQSKSSRSNSSIKRSAAP